MMFGGALMLIFGLLFILMVSALPILVIGAIFAGARGLPGRERMSTHSGARPDRGTEAQAQSKAYPRTCSHCGQGLRSDWTSCPTCGAPS